eukprot:PITA_10824
MAVRRDGPLAQLALPPGFRFHPTDQELIMHYLIKKAVAEPFALPVIGEVDLYKFNPWELPGKSLVGENEWYFFSLRDRKYPNGSRPSRTAGTGYWKATGTDKPICSEIGMKIGIKKALVFYIGKAPRGTKTNWIMHEYRLADGINGASSSKGSKRKASASLRMDDWVLCRLYKKAPGALKAAAEAAAGKPSEESESCLEELRATHPGIVDHDQFNSIVHHVASMKPLRDQKKPNGMEFGDSPMADKSSICVASQASIDYTPWNINKNLVLQRNLMELAQKHLQNSNGVRTEVGYSKYPFDRPPRPPISTPVNVDPIRCNGFQELMPYNEPCGAAPLYPGMAALPVSTDEEVQSNFRLCNQNENFGQCSQQAAFNFDSQTIQSTFSQLEPMAAMFSSSFFQGTEYFQRLQ